VSLHALLAKVRCDRLLFNGTLSVGSQRRYVQALPFEVLSIGGYNDLDCHSVSEVWIQTAHGRTNNIWYRLRKPAPEYVRYHEPFCWVADLGKHFADYLLRHKYAELDDFRIRFHTWAMQQHSVSARFRRWLKQFGSSDFRVAIAAHSDYLWKETTSINNDLQNRPIWGEVDHRALRAIPPQKPYLSKSSKTIITPFIFECFKHMYFAKVLEPRDSTSPAVLKAQHARKKALGFFTTLYTPRAFAVQSQHRLQHRLQPGQVVSVPRDIETDWGDKAEIWLGMSILSFLNYNALWHVMPLFTDSSLRPQHTQRQNGKISRSYLALSTRRHHALDYDVSI
jgi:DNA (cytosine-5)-methyltransferase 1